MVCGLTSSPKQNSLSLTALLSRSDSISQSASEQTEDSVSQSALGQTAMNEVSVSLTLRMHVNTLDSVCEERNIINLDSKNRKAEKPLSKTGSKNV